MQRPEPRIAYADSSALVKLVIEEAESKALTDYLAATEPALATSRIALVEVTRATGVANPSSKVRMETERLLGSCLLVDVTDGLLRAAADLTTREVRTLDAIHLASAARIQADEVITYDGRMLRAARGVGLDVCCPGVSE